MDGDEITVGLEDVIRKGQVGPKMRIRFSLVTGEHWFPAEEFEIFSGL